MSKRANQLGCSHTVFKKSAIGKNPFLRLQNHCIHAESEVDTAGCFRKKNAFV